MSQTVGDFATPGRHGIYMEDGRCVGEHLGQPWGQSGCARMAMLQACGIHFSNDELPIGYTSRANLRPIHSRESTL